jgi:hypothetical protein
MEGRTDELGRDTEPYLFWQLGSAPAAKNLRRSEKYFFLSAP